jgi:signal transduction histidine kinase
VELGRSGWRAVLTDAAIGLGTSLVVTVAIAMDLGGARSPDFLAYLFAVCLGALMFVRRHFPVLALVATAAGLLAYYAAGYPAIGLALPVAAALYSAAEAGKLLISAVTGAALIAVSTFFRLREGESLAYLLGFELASTAGLMFAAIALGAAVRATRLLRAEQLRTARQAAAEREAEARRRVQDERLRIARDLHDVIGHTIALVAVQADVAEEALDDDPGTVRAALKTIRSAGEEAIHELRGTLGLLRSPGEPEVRAPTGTLRNLGSLLAATRESGLAVELRAEGEPVPLPAVVDTTAYRIVQEALTNTLRHAEASRAEVELRYERGGLGIRVTDDGRGAGRRDDDPGGGSGFGIEGMRERAALLGGRVDVAEAPENGGFVVEAWLPVEVGRQ